MPFSDASSPMAPKAPLRTTTMSAAAFNLCKSAIGVGVLFLPSSMRDAGLVLGLALILVGSLSTSATLHFLSRIAARTDMGDYFEVGRAVYGTAGEVAAVTALMLFLFGALIAYSFCSSIYALGFICYATSTEVNTTWYTNERLIIAVASLAIFPLASLRELSKLASASIVGMVCMGLVCILTVCDYFFDKLSTPVTYELFKFDSGVLRAFSNILFAFSNHFTMLAIIPTFVNPTVARRNRLLAISASVVAAFYLIIAAFGYLHFGEGIENDILTAPQVKTLPYAVAQLLVALVIILSYPLLCDPTKKCVNLLLEKAIGPPMNRASDHARNLALTAGLVASSALIAMYAATAVRPILGAFTSLCGSLLIFIFPSLFFLRLAPGKYSISGAERAAAYACIAIGIILAIFGTFFNVQKTISDLSALFATT